MLDDLLKELPNATPEQRTALMDWFNGAMPNLQAMKYQQSLRQLTTRRDKAINAANKPVGDCTSIVAQAMLTGASLDGVQLPTDDQWIKDLNAAWNS